MYLNRLGVPLLALSIIVLNVVAQSIVNKVIDGSVDAIQKIDKENLARWAAGSAVLVFLTSVRDRYGDKANTIIWCLTNDVSMDL